MTIHLSKTRGGSVCGAAGETSADINDIDCDRCELIHNVTLSFRNEPGNSELVSKGPRQSVAVIIGYQYFDFDSDAMIWLPDSVAYELDEAGALEFQDEPIAIRDERGRDVIVYVYEGTWG